MSEGSSGTEYEPYNEDEEVSDSELSLESECRVDEGSNVCIEGDEGMCTFREGEGPSRGQYRSRGRRFTVAMKDKYKVKAPRQSSQLQRRVAVVEESDVVLQSRCIIKKLVGLNARMTAMQKKVIKATTMWPFLEYPDIGRIVQLDGDKVSTDVGEMVCDRMVEWERYEMVRRLLGRSGKKTKFFHNYVSTIKALCEENNGDD
ncbi:hypothetical protein Cgig2_027320 [Carnegiea gigantea]|uniref:Uncharacterized protein n=1 Tax=Carnegiea gigantea TaxID=171969 RepID=A0A9Q1JER8_9CARY|nr:hypothetical protein Cgig2_027320 [Carnegiea gigantea]